MIRQQLRDDGVSIGCLDVVVHSLFQSAEMIVPTRSQLLQQLNGKYKPDAPASAFRRSNSIQQIDANGNAPAGASGLY